MKQFNYETALKFYSKRVVAVLPWCERKSVCVNKDNQEVDWFNKTTDDKWKPLWKILAYYPYTTRVFLDHDKEISEFNFSIGGFNGNETQGLARLLYDVWFGYVERKYHKSDNKTALKLQDRLTGKVVYMGWYDGTFTVSELPAKQDEDFCYPITEINEK